MHSGVKFSIKAGVAVLLIWILLSTRSLDLNALHALMNTPSTVLTVVLLCISMYVLSVLRWQTLLVCQEIKLSFSSATSLVFLSLFLNSFLPGGGIGGDAVRMAYITKVAGDRKTEGALSVFVDRVLGLYAMVTVGAIAGGVLLMEGEKDTLLITLIVIALMAWVGIPIVAFLLYFVVQQNGKVQRFLASEPEGKVQNIVFRIVKSIGLYLRTPGKIFQAFILSLMIQVFVVVSISLLGGALNLEGMPIIGYAFAILWGTLSNLLPLTPGGIGVGEAAFGSVSHLLMGGSLGMGVATVFLAYRLLSMVATLPGLVIWLFPQDMSKVLTRSPETT